MATADSENLAVSVPDEIVVDLPYEDLVLALLRDLGLRRPASGEATAAWFARAGGGDYLLPFAILLGDSHVGNVVLEQIDRHLSCVRLHIYLGAPEARGRGVGRRALDLALDHAFGTLGLNKAWLVVHAENAPALALYRSAGFRVEGRVLAHKGGVRIGPDRVRWTPAAAGSLIMGF